MEEERSKTFRVCFDSSASQPVTPKAFLRLSDRISC
jgi:hypothetical protein